MSRLMRIIPILVLTVLSLTLVPFSRAQDGNSTLGLSDDDYQLLDSAISNTADASSFQLTYSASLSISDPDNGDESLDVAGSGTVTRGDSPTFAITSSGTSDNMGDLPASFNREIRFVDGISYDDLIDLGSGDDRGWQGQPIADLGSTSTLASIIVDPLAFTSTSVAELVNLGDALRSLDLNPYMSATREDDTTVKGQTLAHFTATLDGDKFFESPEFTRKLIELLTEQGQDPGITEDQITAAGILIGSTFRGSGLTIELYVSDDERIARANADINLSIDPTKLGQEGSATSGHLTLDFNLSGYDGDYPVEAPDDAVMIEASASPTPVPATDGDTIAPDAPLTIDLTGSTDLIYHAANPEVITVTAHSLDNVLDTTLEVLDSDNNSLETNDDATSALPGLGPTDSAIESLSLPAEGDYIIRISSFSGAETGQVVVNLTTTEGQPISSDLTGKVLFTTEPLKVYLTGQEAVDLSYRVAGQETISLYVKSLDINPIPVDTTLEVLDANGDQVAFNDDLVSGNVDPGVENLELSSGIYTIRLNTYDTSQVGGVSIELVQGEVKAIGGDEASFKYGDTLDGTVTDTNIDSYTFEGVEGDTITIKAEATNPESPDQDLHLALFSPDGDQLVEDDDSGESLGLGDRDPAIISFTLPGDGLYKVEVDSLFDTSGDYTISLEQD